MSTNEWPAGRESVASSAASEYRIAVVGAGGIAGAYADIVKRSDEFVPVGAFDIRDELSEAWIARAGGGVAAHSLDELLDYRPDVVVIATPPSTHPELAALVMRAGVDVLCEKPLAVHRDLVLAMGRAAEETGRRLAMPAKFRFCADVQATTELMAAGKLGEVRLIENAFTSRVDMSNRWNSKPALSGGGVIIDNGTHSVDLVASMAGPIESVLAVESTRPAGFVVEDTAKLFLRLESGVDATVDLSWSIDKSLDDFLRVYGTLGEVRVGWRESAWRLYGEDWQRLGDGYDKFASMTGALRQFCVSTRSDDVPATGVSEAYASARAIDAAYESLSSGTWVSLSAMR